MAIAGVIAVLALAFVVASLGYLHLEPTGLSPMRNAVSQYGITPFRAGYRIATIAFAFAGIGLAVGIDRATNGRALGTVALLVAFAIARSVISWFPMDAPDGQRTKTGHSHGLLAIAAFASVTSAAFKLASVLTHESTWHDLAPVSKALAWVMLACLIGMGLARWLPGARARFGAIERIFYLAAITWFAVFAIACITNTP